MPQLIAMIIVVVGAIIYMFQTFGGTGDTIKGIAQKTSIVTELNNLKLGLRFAAEAGQIMDNPSTAGEEGVSVDAVDSLQGLAKLGYFAEQINEQLEAANKGLINGIRGDNIYYAISFGGDDKSGKFSLIAPTKGFIPGIFVDLEGSKLDDNKDFLEAQISHDLSSIALIDRSYINANLTNNINHTDDSTNTSALGRRLPAISTIARNAAGDALKKDGKFAVYFKDFSASQVVVGSK